MYDPYGDYSNEQYEEYEDNYDDSDTAFMGAVTSQSSPEPWKIDIRVNQSEPITFKIDTGADVTVLPYRLYKKAMGK